MPLLDPRQKAERIVALFRGRRPTEILPAENGNKKIKPRTGSLLKSMTLTDVTLEDAAITESIAAFFRQGFVANGHFDFIPVLTNIHGYSSKLG